MNFCINYNQFTEHAKYINDADEWTIVFNEKDDTLLEFLDMHLNKRINLVISDIKYLSFCKELTKKYQNVYIKFSQIPIELLEQENLDFKFFIDILVSSLDTIQQLIQLKVTDIYIVEELGFDLKNISAYIHEQGISVRVFPNVAQSQWKNLPALKKFFIRPEDLDSYNNLIDTIEFWDADKQIDVYFEVYKIKKRWFGPLNEIIKSFNSDIDNKFIIPKFAEMRIRCNKICLKGGKCSRCEQIENLANTLKNSNLIVTPVDNK